MDARGGPPAIRSLHLLRSLLREASYLPDAAARDYFRRYIVARFKAYQPSANGTAAFDVHAVAKYRHRAFKRRHTGIINARVAQQQRVAHKGLNFLRRANQGEGPCIQRVLWAAYGRLGRRKHALLGDLLKPDPLWPEGTPPLQQLYRSSLQCLQYFEAPVARDGINTINISRQYPRLRAIVTSQVQNERALGREIKRPHLRTPVLNIWERPMPLKRAANNVRRWYAETMTRLLPALPADEWDSIDAMSTGRQRIAFVPRRRTVGSVSEERSLEQMVRHSLAMGKPSKADRRQGMDRPRAFSARYMQRLYSRLLALSCKLEYDEVRKQWTAVWGQPKASRPASHAAPVDDALFSGVDVRGRVTKAEQHVTPGRSSK
ncbi:hypothetical protein C7974DRAFT_311627 [Boeremia exigua]|uniref:uncharacterized protein n=1 Tax=Boeremia exigua TaxID=749465 RepID=UPI001E8D7D8B|nr:uncharacterized protein C7974DRAFT_311627 [Boeremia exigua]KAH6629313.1 hypothetical protein C7974DRAFT_311627 [Boeremia exigua]